MKADFILLLVRVLLLALGPLIVLPAWSRLMRTGRPSVPVYLLAAWGVFLLFAMTNISATALYCYATHLGEAGKCTGSSDDWGLNPGFLIGVVAAVFLGWVWIRRTLPDLRGRALHLSIGLVGWYVALLSIIEWMDPGR